MSQWLSSWFGRQGFLPHGYCFDWSPGVLWSMVAGDAGIALAYFAIPALLVYFLRKRGGSPFNVVAWLFSAFIVTCGVTHVLNIVTIWQPIYNVEAVFKLLTAAISLLTAAAMWPLIPKALAMPTLQQLRKAIAEMEHEVSHRQRAEAALAHSQESLAVTLASIGAGIITTDAEGCIAQMNPLAQEVTGWTLAEAQGRSFWEVWNREGMPTHYLDQTIVGLAAKECLTISNAHRVVVISRDGKRTPVEARLSLLYAGDEKVRGNVPEKASGLVLVFRDTSQLDQAQLDAQQLAAIVNSSHDAIIGMDLDRRITSWNTGAQTLYGYTAEEAIGQSVLMLLPYERRDEEDRVFDEISQGTVVPPFKTQRLRKDGTPVDVMLTLSPIRDVDGQIVGASKITRDITHEIRNERLRLDAIRLEGENRQMEEANRLKSQFLANMSHELRTPLNAIIGFADILRMNQVSPDSPKFKEFVGHISTSGKHLLQLINDVLDLSKVESGKFEFFPEPINPRQVVDEALAIMGTQASRKQLKLTGFADASLNDIQVDVGRLKQVLYNLLSNAIKFTPKGGEVSVRFLPEGPNRFRVEVQDTGIGIAAKDLPHLFGEFVQIDAGLTKRYEGTGLGLALTRSLVEAQGGSVGVSSTPGVGSVFHVVLPRNPLSMQALATTDVNENSDISRDLQRVLIIEDDRGERIGLTRSLSQIGFEVERALSGGQALEKTRRKSFSALTLDLLLPDRKGLDLLDEIRNTALNRDAPVVALTMRASGEPHAASFPVSDVLRKPLREDELRTALNRTGLLSQTPSKRSDADIDTQPVIMVIDDQDSALTLMSETLQNMGLRTVGFSEGRIALQELDKVQPDAIVLDLMMPDMDGFAVLDALNDMPAWRRTPVFVWTSADLSAHDYARLGRSAHAASKRALHDGPLAEALKQRVRSVPAKAQVEQA